MRPKRDLKFQRGAAGFHQEGFGELVGIKVAVKSEHQRTHVDDAWHISEQFPALFIYSDVLSFQHYWHSALLGNCGIALSTSNFHQLFYSQSYLRQPCVLWGTNSLRLRPTVWEKKFISKETWKLPAVSTNSELYFTLDGELVKYLSCK